MLMDISINTRRMVGKRDEKIYGQFLEHFHRQVYAGIYEPGSPRSNSRGYRTDVADALKNIKVPVIRWPGGCFVSSYHWKDAIGTNREATYDKAWRSEESNEFGTDEFLDYCALIGAQPYICTNAGTGTPEEMSDWVEYCNLKSAGKWARKRIENGHPEPFNVKYWSIGNENYGQWEIGAKSSQEWGRFVLESAKMMKRVDPSIEILAASLPDIDWNISLIKEAGKFLDWISIHGYWDPIWFDNKLGSYETCMAYTMKIEEPIQKARHILGALGYLGKIKIAYDEWNLRGWYHPNVHNFADVPAEDCIKARDLNDENSSYTMADAVFTACFLNQCLKHCDMVKMANFAPAVNTRGAIYTHKDGIVKRSTYYVFEIFTHYMKEIVVDTFIDHNQTFMVRNETDAVEVTTIDSIATISEDGQELSVSLVNKHPMDEITLTIRMSGYSPNERATLYQIASNSVDSYNDSEHPDEIRIEPIDIAIQDGMIQVTLPAHSVNVLVMQ